ncbi:TIGR02452 family protein [Thiorhodovibrio frisius]|uniref:TIGR02452 family protein n=1 Tax=Thiorhodovibrio frisius TaxID=631362 RepID=H8YW37_9GAMM|nr:TIGR02452 family protein [Thiorhodovibrio frisius]EIC23828.1 TIGR02452 family protein [Thiorhodovibrio frisius]WPL22988.1 von Willebrand factor type A domain protein [Thiorhodovibrio frisius]
MSAIAKCLSEVVVGKPTSHKNLTLYPLLADGPEEPGYRLLEAALSDHSARVTEVSESGHVPELKIINEGAQPVLLLDGEELVGAKQNRILNLTVLAPAQKTTIIPVSCVEAGRWHATSAEFSGARRAHFAAGRARKSADVNTSLRQRGSRESNQSAVWRDIETRSRRMGVNSGTNAAAALYESHRQSLDAFRSAFTPQTGQCGALFSLNGRILGLDLFDSPTTLAAVLSTLVESYALDALDAHGETVQPISAPTAADIKAWLDVIAGAEFERFPAVGEGEDWRFDDSHLTGGALVKDDRVIHLCAFRISAAEDSEEALNPAEIDTFSLALATDRALIRRQGHSKRVLQVRLQVPTINETTTPLDLALVLDASHSLSAAHWTEAQHAVRDVLERLGPDDRIALVIFNDVAEILLPLTPISEETRQAVEIALQNHHPGGGANLGEGWLTGCGLVGAESDKARRRHCLVLSAGQPDVGITAPATLAEHARALRNLGVVTSTFGLGDTYLEGLLAQLADAGGGYFQDIADAETIPVTINRHVEELGNLVSDHARLDLSWEGDLKVEPLGPWSATASAHALSLELGDLMKGETRDLLLRLRFPGGPKNTDCPLRMVLRDGDHHLVEEHIHWTWVDSATRHNQAHESEVEHRFAQHLAHQARIDVARSNRDGQLDQACAHLMDVAKQIRKEAGENPQNMALAAALEAETERYRKALPAREIKEQISRSGSLLRGRRQDGARMRINTKPRLHYLPTLDSDERAAQGKALRDTPRAETKKLGESAQAAIDAGHYSDAAGQSVDWSAAIAAAKAAKQSLPPDAALPEAPPPAFATTRVRVINAMTLDAAWRLSMTGARVLALNFANGIQPGGGFLQGNRAQESVLCRSSALIATLEGDPMYAAHAERPQPDSTDWAILSPDVPVFRDDAGRPRERPWPLSILTCAAPYAPTIGQDMSIQLMQSRIRRILAIARAHGYETLVLGAWGCGTFGNDPVPVAAAFHAALREQVGAFDEIVFAVTDWSPERRFLAPFAAEFKAQP